MSAQITTLNANDSGSTSRGVINTNFENLSDEVDLKASSADITSGVNSAIATHEADTTTHGATGAVVGTTNTQTLTNKTLTSPTINTGALVSPTISGTPVISTDINFGANTAYFTETDNGNSSTADTIDWGTSNKQKSTLTGNCTFTFTAPPGPCSLILKLVQDATGSRTVTWPATVKWAGGVAPTLTTTASRIDIIALYYDGTNYYGNASLNFTA